MSDECVFCKIIKGEISCHKVFENEALLAFLDINPINEGHTLVIPKKHVPNILEMEKADLCQLMEATQKVAVAAKAAVKADGINLGVNTGKAAGQIVFHAHIHVIPRFDGDGLRSWTRTHETAPDFKAVSEKIKAALQT